MAHELHVKSNLCPQWVKAVQGLRYLREGLAPFCDDIAKQQYKDMIKKIQQTKTPQPTIPCVTCQITTLQPDHSHVSKKCPLKQDKCNCCFPNKKPCPNNVCGAIYDSIIRNHASIPPAPFWRNSDAQQWSADDPWSICKCFINAPGYKDKTSPFDTDCAGLLHVIINNKYFHSHIGCNVKGRNNLFSQVRQYRNEIFHSTSMELEESKANSYIDEMISILQDGKKLVYRQDAKQAVLKLQDLKKDFIITTKNLEEIVRQIREEMEKIGKLTEIVATKEEYGELKNELTEVKAQMSETEKEYKELKRKFTILETEQKEQTKRLKVEDSPQQMQLKYEKAKSEGRKELIKHYNNTLLHVSTSPLQPQGEKCSFNEIYIRPKITREIKGKNGEIKEEEIKTMSEMFTKNGLPQNSVYVVGDAGSGKTSFCKYLVNCWCLAHSEEHEAAYENENGNGKNGDDRDKYGDDKENEGGNEKHKEHGSDIANEDVSEERGGDIEIEGGNENHGGDKHVGNSKRHWGNNEKHEGDKKEYGGYSLKHGSDSEKQVGDNEEHGGDNEEHGGDSEKNVGASEKHGGDNEENGNDIEEHGGDSEENECDSEKHGGDNEEHGGDIEEHGGDSEKNVCDSEKHRCDNEEYGGDSIKHVGDSKKHGGDNEEYRGDSEKRGGDDEEHGGDSKKQVGDSEKHGGDNEVHGGDIEEHGCDSEKHVCDNEKHVSDNEEHGGDIEEHEGDSEKNICDSETHGSDNEEHGGDSEKNVCDSEKHGDDNEVHGGDSEKNVGDSEKHGGNNEEYEGDSEKNICDSETHGSDNEEHGGDSEMNICDSKTHGSDNEEHEGDSEKNICDSETHGSDNEEHGGDSEKNVCDSEKHGDDNEVHGGDSEKNVGDSEKHGGDTEEHGGDSKKHVGDSEKHGGDNEEHVDNIKEHGGDSENHWSDNEEHGGDSKKKVCDSEKHLGGNEEHGDDIEEHEDDSENYICDSENHGGDNEEHGGDRKKHVGDSEKHWGGNEKHGDDIEEHEDDRENNICDSENHGGDNEEHGGDIEEHGGDSEKNVCDSEKHRCDNEEHGGESIKHVGDSKKHRGDNEEYRGDSEKRGGDDEEHRGDSKKQVGDSENHGGDNEGHGGDIEEHGCDSEKHVCDNEKHVSDNEEHGGDIEEHGGDSEKNICDSEKHGSDNEEQGGDSEKNVCDSEKHGDDNEVHGGDSEKNVGDSEKHGDDTEEHGGDSKKHVGDSENHGGDNEEHVDNIEEHGGDSEKHWSDNEEHGGDSKKNVCDSEKHWGGNEEHVDDIEEHVGDSEKHWGDNEEHGGDIAKHGGDSEKHVCDCEKHGGDNEEHGGDSEKHVRDSEKHGDGNEIHVVDSEKNVGDSEKHWGGNEEHGDDIEEHEDDSEKNVCDSEKHGGDNEEHIGDSEKRGGDNEEHGSDSIKHVGDSEKHGGDNEEQGGDIEEHEGNSEKHVCDSEKHWDDNEEHGGDSEKNICDREKHGVDNEEHGGDSEKIVGDSEKHGGNNEEYEGDCEDGTCLFKKLVYDSETYEQEFKAVKEMKKFDFLFYIPLRKYQKIDTIDEMLQKRYEMKILSTLLEEESSRVMILLDGLDEWSSENVPEHGTFRKYTKVTTSRPWKFHNLSSSDVEIEQSLKLKGFDLICEREIVYRTVSLLNRRRNATKKAEDCLKKLQEKSLESSKQVPIMLQQLICLWFDGKLDKTSRCAIYTGMLELFFTWNDMKTTGTSTRHLKGSRKVDFPKYFADKNIFKLNSHLIYEVSQFAYETLFKCPKDKSLAFDICIFDELEISDEVRENCLKLGIMTEDECTSLSVSEPPSSLFSFIHKSVQEFLAAVFIGIKFNSKVGSSDCTGNDELAEGCSQFIKKIFQKCSANDVLEQSNVIIMLCGLEPRLATHVSKYIYNTLSEDSDIQKYRRTLDRQRDDHTVFSFLDCKMYNNARFITDLQMLMFALIEECNGSCTPDSYPVFYIGDLVIDSWGQYCYIVCSCIKQHKIVPDFVQSIDIDYIDPRNAKFTKYLREFRYLEKIEIKHERALQRLLSHLSHTTQSNEQMIDEINNCVAKTIETNILTLKSLSLGIVNSTDENNPVYKTVVSNLPSMTNLVAISMTNTTMSHDDTNTFCNFLEEKSHLEQIYLGNVICESKDQHDVNLSKHQQLQYLHLKNALSVTDASTTNLEIFRFEILEKSNHEKLFDIFRKSYKLKEFELYGDDSSRFQLCESKYNTILTERLVRELPVLHNLVKFGLWRCRLTDNIIQSPLEMKSLRDIKIVEVIMSLTTWQRFADSLLRIPHTVDVSVKECYITGDGEESNDYAFPVTSQGIGGVKGKDAIQYVKDRDQLFHRKCDDNSSPFYFSTKKVIQDT